MSTDLQTVKAKIRKQRRLELIGEGHRLFDLFRKGETRRITAANALKPREDIAPNNFSVRYPISLVEMDVNPNMVQNSGYN